MSCNIVMLPLGLYFDMCSLVIQYLRLLVDYSVSVFPSLVISFVKLVMSFRTNEVNLWCILLNGFCEMSWEGSQYVF